MLHILLQSSVTPSSCRPTPRLTHPPVAFTFYPIYHHLLINSTVSRKPKNMSHSSSQCGAHKSSTEEWRGGWGEEGRSGCRERDRRSAALGMQSVGQSSTASCPGHTTCQTKHQTNTTTVYLLCSTFAVNTNPSRCHWRECAGRCWGVTAAVAMLLLLPCYPSAPRAATLHN